MDSATTLTLAVGMDAGPMVGHGGISLYVRPLIASESSLDIRLIVRCGWQQGFPSSPRPWE